MQRLRQLCREDVQLHQLDREEVRLQLDRDEVQLQLYQVDCDLLFTININCGWNGSSVDDLLSSRSDQYRFGAN